MMSDQVGDMLVSFGGHTLRVESDAPKISNPIQTHLRHCRADTQGTELITEFIVKRIDQTTFAISENGNILFSKIGYDLTLQVLMTELISRLVAVCDRGLVLHAAALAWKENGLILCGKSSSGKSSLAAWLTAEGFQYLTDEVIDVPLDEDVIYGLPRSIFLKSGSAFIWQSRLPDVKMPGFLSFEDGSAWIAPQLFNPMLPASQAIPSLMVFPSYRPASPFEATKLTAGETLFHILQNATNARNLPGHGMEAAARLARRVQAFALTYSDIEETTAWVKRTITT